jgi:ribosomal protein S18 acetylase RimI-like enzyme
VKGVVIRAARPKDAQAIDALSYAAALHQHRGDPLLLAPPKPHSCEWSGGALACANDAVCLVVALRREVIGLVQARIVAEGRAMFVPHTHGMIEMLAVLPEYRSRGVGSSLQVAAENWLIERGVSAFRLSVFASNEGAMKLYARRGYVPVTMFMQRKVEPEPEEVNGTRSGACVPEGTVRER